MLFQRDESHEATLLSCGFPRPEKHRLSRRLELHVHGARQDSSGNRDQRHANDLEKQLGFLAVLIEHTEDISAHRDG